MTRRRFTLIELVVALLILSLTMGALYSFGRQVTLSWERLRRDQRRLADLMTLDRALDTLLANAVPFLWPDPEDANPGKERLLFEGRRESLLFATLHQPSPDDDEGGIRFVVLSLHDGNLLANYHSRPFRDWRDAGEGGRVAVLAPNVKQLSFQYADFSPAAEAEWGDRLEWVAEWDVDKDKPRQEIPLAILVTVVWQDDRIESWLRRTSGQGYRERYGKWQPRKE